MARIVKKNNYYKNLNNNNRGPGVSGSSRNSGSYSSNSGPKPGSNSRVVKRNAASKKYNTTYSYEEEPELSASERREITENINDLTALKNALSDNYTDNIRRQIETAKKLLQSAQDDLGLYWTEPKSKVNEYIKRIEDQKNLVNNLINKIEDEILVQITKEISQNKNMLGV